MAGQWCCPVAEAPQSHNLPSTLASGFVNLILPLNLAFHKPLLGGPLPISPAELVPCAGLVLCHSGGHTALIPGSAAARSSTLIAGLTPPRGREAHFSPLQSSQSGRGAFRHDELRKGYCGSPRSHLEDAGAVGAKAGSVLSQTDL